ncbi:MAG: helix-turn-helix transcriptional regulator [Bifidobacterium aquikefiri]|uniref:helix-turn-helix domain-containing protein n=1 Tax=Bifidobacterium aquikefiri TaxID=1653207 RepID=UPI0039E8AEBD
MSDFHKYLSKKLKDPEFAQEYDALEPEYQAARGVMQARIDAGLTQQQLADVTGIRASNISRLETGGSMPSLRTLQQLAKGLHKTLSIQFV